MPAVYIFQPKYLLEEKTVIVEHGESQPRLPVKILAQKRHKTVEEYLKYRRDLNTRQQCIRYADHAYI